MRFDFDTGGRAFYLTIREVEESDISATAEAVPGTLFLDFDGAGRLVGIEVFEPELIALLPVLLDAHGIAAPEGIRFGALADSLARGGDHSEFEPVDAQEE